jgi:hypothetical protein
MIPSNTVPAFIRSRTVEFDGVYIKYLEQWLRLSLKGYIYKIYTAIVTVEFDGYVYKIHTAIVTVEYDGVYIYNLYSNSYG